MGLVRMAARTAVVAGTATAVSGRVQRRQAARWDEQDSQQYAQQQAAAAPPPPQEDDATAQLQGACRPVHRDMLRQRIAALEARLMEVQGAPGSGGD